MTWPTGAVPTTNVDATTDDPELGVVDIKSAFDKLNQIIAHVSSFVQGLLDDAAASDVRTTLGLGALAVKSTIATADLDADAVTYAKIQNVSATNKMLGRATAGAGDIEEIDVTAAGRALIDDADIATQRATLKTPTDQMGTGSGVATLVGVANVNTTQVGNIGGGTDDLMTYTLPANSLSANKKGIRVTAWGTVTNNANSKGIGFSWGSQALTSFTVSPSTASDWMFEIIILRTGSNTQDVLCRVSDSNGTMNNTGERSTFQRNAGTQTDTSDIIFKLTALGTADNDVVQKGMLVEYIG